MSRTKTNLPPLPCQNVEYALIYGKEMTDTNADWVKKYVTGSFAYSPYFKCNALIAVVQVDKNFTLS
jgi:hypothetical protein